MEHFIWRVYETFTAGHEMPNIKPTDQLVELEEDYANWRMFSWLNNAYWEKTNYTGDGQMNQNQIFTAISNRVKKIEYHEIATGWDYTWQADTRQKEVDYMI